jgi:hypothetical protein
VFNLQWSVLSAALGFVLSLFLSLVSGAGVFSLLRALIFGAGFFVVSSVLYWMVKRFLPELLVSEDDDLSGLNMGSQVDISLGDDDSALTALLQQGSGDDSPDAALDLGEVERLGGSGFQVDEFALPKSGDSGGGEFSAGILDQDAETDYTSKDTAEGFKPFVFPSLEISSGSGSAGSLQGKAGRPVSAAVLPSEGIDTLETLPSFGDDLAPVGGNSKTPVSVAFPGVDRNGASSEGAVEEFRGKVKESALAIQTLLKRD